MNEVFILIALFLIGSLIGFILTLFINNLRYKNQSISILKDARKKGEQIKQDKLLQAKEKFIELKTAHEKSIFQKNKDLELRSTKIRQKEQSLNSKFEEYNRNKQSFSQDLAGFTERTELLNRKE